MISISTARRREFSSEKSKEKKENGKILKAVTCLKKQKQNKNNLLLVVWRLYFFEYEIVSRFDKHLHVFTHTRIQVCTLIISLVVCATVSLWGSTTCTKMCAHASSTAPRVPVTHSHTTINFPVCVCGIGLTWIRRAGLACCHGNVATERSKALLPFFFCQRWSCARFPPLTKALWECLNTGLHLYFPQSLTR